MRYTLATACFTRKSRGAGSGIVVYALVREVHSICSLYKWARVLVRCAVDTPFTGMMGVSRATADCGSRLILKCGAYALGRSIQFYFILTDRDCRV